MRTATLRRCYGTVGLPRMTLLEELRAHVDSVVAGVDRRAKVVGCEKLEDRAALRVAIEFQGETRTFEVSLRQIMYPANRLRGWRVAAFRQAAREGAIQTLALPAETVRRRDLTEDDYVVYANPPEGAPGVAVCS